eukprot:2355023-Amphidinium_carterae.1
MYQGTTFCTIWPQSVCPSGQGGGLKIHCRCDEENWTEEALGKLRVYISDGPIGNLSSVCEEEDSRCSGKKGAKVIRRGETSSQQGDEVETQLRWHHMRQASPHWMQTRGELKGPSSCHPVGIKQAAHFDIIDSTSSRHGKHPLS